MLEDLTDIELLALLKLAGAEAKKRDSRANVKPGEHSGEVMGIHFSLTIGEDTTMQGTDRFTMARFAALLCERLDTKLKAQKKRLSVEEMLKRSLSVDLDNRQYAGFNKEVTSAVGCYLKSLDRRPRKGAVRAAYITKEEN